MIHRVLVGGTATGKKTVAARLHRRHGLRLLSMDSVKVYRGMDIGTDKPSARLQAEAPFALLDLVGHDQGFSAGRWVQAAREQVLSAAGPVLFVGGTPLYLQLLLRGLFPGPGADVRVRAELDALWQAAGEAGVRAELRAGDPAIERRLLPGDRKRLLRALEVLRVTGRPMSRWQAEHTQRPLPGAFRVAALRHEPQTHRKLCERRIGEMFRRGLVEEVRALRSRAPFAREPGRAIGYAEGQQLLDGELDEAQAAERMRVRTRQLVRRQRLFLARFEEIRWVDVEPAQDVEAVLSRVELALDLA